MSNRRVSYVGDQHTIIALPLARGTVIQDGNANPLVLFDHQTTAIYVPAVDLVSLPDGWPQLDEAVYMRLVIRELRDSMHGLMNYVTLPDQATKPDEFNVANRAYRRACAATGLAQRTRGVSDG